MKKLLFFSIYALLSFTLFIGLGYTGSKMFPFTGFSFKFLLCLPSYYLLTIVILRKDNTPNSGILIFGDLLLPFLILYMFLVDIKVTLISLPGTIAQVLGILLAFTHFYLFPKVNRWLLVTGITMFSIFGAYYFYPRYTHYLFFQNYTGELENYPIFTGTIEGIDRNYESIEIDPRDKEFIVLDAWNSSCNNCFMEFAQLEEIKAAYESDSISFYSLNYPLTIDTLEKVNQYVTDNWDLNYVYIQDTSFYPDHHLLNIFPSYYIINRKREVIFRGNLKNLKIKLNELFTNTVS